MIKLLMDFTIPMLPIPCNLYHQLDTLLSIVNIFFMKMCFYIASVDFGSARHLNKSTSTQYN